MARVKVQLFGVALGCATGIDFVATSMLATGAVHIRSGVYATPDDFLWCLTAYAGAAIIANLVLRRVADYIGYRDLTLLGLFVATIGCLLCTLSNNVVELSLSIAVQGLGAGGLFAASRTLIQLVAAPSERAVLLRPFVAGALGLSAVTPWITATLMLDAGWRTIFVFQAVACVATAILVASTYPQCVRPPCPPTLDRVARLDWFTVLIVAAGSLILLHGLADLRIYTASNSLGVFAWPATGVLLMACGMFRLHRHPQPWINTRRLNGPRYLTGIGLYATYYVFSGLWSYLVSSLMQLGLGFTFETTGRTLTIAGAFGALAALTYVLFGMQLPGARRYFALGYLMVACAAWLLADRVMTGLSIDRLLPVLMLQSAAVPFSLLVVAKLTFTETAVEDFAHAYQMKNIVRQIALAAGTGIAAQYLQYSEAVTRANLVARIDAAAAWHQSVEALEAMSTQIDQQAVLVGASNLLAIVASACVVVAIVAAFQRWLR